MSNFPCFLTRIITSHSMENLAFEMTDDYTTNSYYLTYTFILKRLGECVFNLGVKGFICCTSGGAEVGSAADGLTSGATLEPEKDPLRFGSLEVTSLEQEVPDQLVKTYEQVRRMCVAYC